MTQRVCGQCGSDLKVRRIFSEELCFPCTRDTLTYLHNRGLIARNPFVSPFILAVATYDMGRFWFYVNSPYDGFQWISYASHEIVLDNLP